MYIFLVSMPLCIILIPVLILCNTRLAGLFIFTHGVLLVLCVTSRGINVTGDKRYHGVYVVHQTVSIVLSDGSVLRYVSQRQADTQNTKSNTLLGRSLCPDTP